MNDFGDIEDIIDAETAAEAERMAAQKAKESKEAHIQKLARNIKRAKQHDEHYRKKWAEDRKVARGENNSAVSTNLISAILAVLAAFLYAKNPDLNVTPSKSVNRNRIQDYREFAMTLEIMVSRMFHDANLKKKAKRWIRGTQTVGIGWLKAIMQTGRQEQPLVRKGINDLQAQIAKIQRKEVAVTMNDDEEAVLISEIESNIKAAEAQLEITVAEGLVIDYTHPEDVIVAPECGEVENYLEAPWICFEAYKTEDEALEITGWTTDEQKEYLKSANRYQQRPRKGESGEQGGNFVAVEGSKESESDIGFYLFHETWSLSDGVVYTTIDGCTEEWARQPYAPTTGKRFYPAFLLAFHFIDGERYPQSDVDLLKDLQMEYNETRSDYRIHRQRSRPGVIFNEMKIDPNSVSKVTDSQTQEYIGINPVDSDVDLNTVFVSKKYNPIDPGLYDTNPIQRDMEKVSGAQEALQSSVQIEKTATEANIQEAGRGARTGARLDDLEEVLTELAEYTVQLALQTMDQADAERYAGPNAVWLNLSAEEALTIFNFEIKAGSTGKPKTSSDREAWGILMPLIKELIRDIGDARAKGAEWAAKPMIALLQETLTRLDDHADIEMFLPVVPPEALEQMNKPDPAAEAETKLDEASAVDKMASAVQKVPELVFSPQIQQLLGMDSEQNATVDALMSALQGQQATSQPPAPNPV